MSETNEDEEKRKSFIDQETTYGEPIPKTPPTRPVPPPVDSSNADNLTERRIGLLALAAMVFLIGVSVGLWIAEREE